MKGWGAPLVLFAMMGCGSAVDVALWEVEGSTDSGPPGAAPRDPCKDGQRVCLHAMSIEPRCGESLELRGAIEVIDERRWRLTECADCMRCAGEPTMLEIRAPKGLGPLPVPSCGRITLDYAAATSPWSCALVGVAVWPMVGSEVAPRPTYVAASIVSHPPRSVTGFEVREDPLEAKPCREAGCCPAQPGTYALSWLDDAATPLLALVEGEAGVAAIGDARYFVTNLRSHIHEGCDAVPHVDWVMRRAPERTVPESETSS